ncbi:hypothetical protein ACFYUV_38065 [Nonomuraea sp. NPDC003560]|uniref:hypothetical protein n=1 Tax=Nonomuraea sp. NPDC003560 TaxID=3364341 RepID=UPI00369E6CF5
MARTFDGVDDSIGVAVTGLAAQTTAGSYVAVMRRNGTTLATAIGLNTSGAARVAELALVNTTNVLRLRAATSAQSAFTVTSSDGWVLVAATKAAGSATPRMHKYVYSTGAWTHQDGSAAIADAGPVGGGTAFFGSASDSDIAAVGIWDRVLSDGEVESLAHSLVAWSASAPVGMWVLDQADTAQTVPDWTGRGGQQNSITGTIVATSSAPIGYGAPVRITPHPSVPANVTPAVVAAPWSIPAPGISRGLNAKPAAVLASWGLPTPDIFVGSSPPTNVQPNLIGASWTLPAPTITTNKNVNLNPAPLVVPWTLPAPVISVPVNPGDDLDGPGQISYNGFRIGNGTPYRMTELVGADIDMPDLDDGDVDNPNSDGAMPGEKFSLPRNIIWAGKIAVPRDQMQAAMEAWRQGLPKPRADEQVPIAMQIMGTIYIAYGVAIRRTPGPIDLRYRHGFTDKLVAQFKCADPRLYSRELGNATIADGQTVEVANFGNTDTPRFELRAPGPATTPLFEIAQTLPDGTPDVRVVEFNLTVPAGKQLVIDVFLGTATIDGVSQMSHLTGASIGVPDFVLGPGFISLTYETATGTAPATTALWRHAWQ